MKRKIITIVVCGLLLMSGIAMIPKNIDVKAEAGSGNGNEVGINTTYIHYVAENLSNIVKDIRYPKGRTYGTPGEGVAARSIKNWMEEIGLYNVHNESITYGYNLAGYPKAIDKKVEDLSEGLVINNTNIKTSEFYIEPPQNGASDCRALWDYFRLHENYTEDPTYWDLLTNNFSYYDVNLQQRPQHYFLNHVLAWSIVEITKRIENGTIFNFDTFAWYMLEKTAEYFNFSWDDLINDPLNTTIVNNSQYNDFFNYSTEPTGSNFVYVEEEPSFNPNPAPDLVPPQCLIDAFPDPQNTYRLFWPYIVLLAQSIFWSVCKWNCRGLILYDFNNDTDTHNIPDYHLFLRPFIFVNNSIGTDLENHINDPGYITKFWINQTWENNVSSFNVIGQINGTDPNKTVIVDCLYDGVRSQAAADSAIGIGILLSIAKEMQYLNDTYHIKPKYTVKFVTFGGEEYGMLGALSYDWRHPNETITTLIDLNQLGFNQTGPLRLSLDITTNNNLTANTTLKAITDDTNYIQKMNNTTNFSIIYQPGGDDSDDSVFAQAVLQGRRNCTTIGFLKDTTWTLHHRDGNNHTEGDVMKYFNWTDVSATASMIWNVTKYYTLNPNCSISNVSFTTFDSPNDGDTLNDSIRTNFTIHTIMPNDIVRVEMSLSSVVGGMGYNNTDAWDADYIINNGSQNVSIIFTIPDGVTEGNYTVCFKVYNSTGRINRIVCGALGTYYNDSTGASNWSHLYHPLGYTKIGGSIQGIQNRITGSVFTANENARADNITAYINQNFAGPARHQCMLYRENDSTLIGTTTEDWHPLGGQAASPWWAVFNFTGTKPLLVKGVRYVITCWSNNSCSGIYYDDSHDPTTGSHESYTYGAPPNPAYFIPDLRYYSIYCSYTPDVVPPIILNVSSSPDTVGFGSMITIHTNVTDDNSGVNTVTVNITFPDQTHGNYTMSLISGSHYRYVFGNTWKTGQYNYTIYATDTSTNINGSGGHHFHVSADAKISVATLKDSYTGTQYINITDPPDPPSDYTLVGRGLDWNNYYNDSTGQNILEVTAGPTNYHDQNGQWTPINCTLRQLTTDDPAYTYGYRAGNDHGLYHVYFKPNAQNDWPVAFAYNKSTDPSVHVIRSKFVGVGYLDPQTWAYQYLQNAQSSQGQIDDNTVTYPGVFTGTDVSWRYTNTELKEAITLSNATKTVLQNHLPSSYGLDDATSYLVFITKLDYQNLNLYNASGMLTGNVTVADNGVDFKDALGVFKCGLPLGDAFELNNQSVRQSLTYRIIHSNGNIYLLSGLKLSDLSMMMFPVVIDPTLTVYSTASDGYIQKLNGNYTTARTSSTGTVSNSGTYLSIGQKKDLSGTNYAIYRGFLLFNTTALPSNAYIDNATLSLYKKDDYSTTDFDITVQNGQPTYPHDPLQTSDYNMSRYSGNGGTLATGGLHSGYNYLSLTQLSWITKNGTTKLCLRSSRDINANAPTGNEYVNMYANEQGSGYQPKLVINYRNQSKIKNTGSTDIKGYLLIQIQYYNTQIASWVLDQNTIDETSPRTINSGTQLALDRIFNNHVRASDLTHGTGTYRVYTAFRDLFGNVLKTNDGVEMKAWWQFSKI